MPRRLTLTAGLIAATVAGTLTLSVPPAAAQAGGFDYARPEVVASGLAVPWGLGFLPDGSALVTERNSARILQLRPGQAAQALGTVPNVVAGGEGGLLGLAVSPTYAQDQYVYAYFTAANDNRIVRFRLNAIGTQQVVLSGIPKSSIHNGGRIAFGPDGNLYAGVGDANVTSNAQNTNSLAAASDDRVIRFPPTGGGPQPGTVYGDDFEAATGWAANPNGTDADFLRVSVVGSSTSVVFTQTGAATNRAGAWATASADLSGLAGQTVRLRIEAADGGTASLLEAGVDDVRITSG